MEMNTRLQVEHPVTEAVTGLDLVALQLRIAAGEPLPLAQQDVRITGHAIEVRLCAEDARTGLHAAQRHAGAVARRALPLRTEHALRSGAQVPPFYDSMIAKLVAHGATRDAARHRLLAGLQDTVALGLPTNQHFLQRCLAHPVFAAGQANTGFVAQHREALLAGDPAFDAGATALAALLLQLGPRGWPSPLAPRLPIALRFTLDGMPREALGHAARRGAVRCRRRRCRARAGTHCAGGRHAALQRRRPARKRRVRARQARRPPAHPLARPALRDRRPHARGRAPAPPARAATACCAPP